MTASRLLHMGGAVVDFVYRAEALPDAGKEVVASSFTAAAGGGFNMMAAAARCGLEVAYGGPHGTGPHGDLVREALKGAGIALLRRPSAGIDTGNCVVIVTPDGERSFLSWQGAEGCLRDPDLAAIRPRERDFVFVSGYTLSYPESGGALVRWLEGIGASVPVVFDPAPVVRSIPRELLRAVLSRTTWLSANAAEAGAITGETEPRAQARALLERHCPSARGVVLRGGAGGAWLCLAGGALRHVPAFRVEAVDTNGAGDTHAGAFLAALSHGRDPLSAVSFANAAAAVSVTRPGGSSAPDLAEVEAFMETRRMASA